jgi:multiple sugar transport system permease protein
MNNSIEIAYPLETVNPLVRFFLPRGRKPSMFLQLMRHLFLIVFGITMIYPLLWLFFGTFKPNEEIFTSGRLLPITWQFGNYRQGWNAIRGHNFGTFFLNSLQISLFAVLGNLISCSLAAYAFARIKFPLKNFWFAVMLGTMMLPREVLMVPQYLLFNWLGWINSFRPLTVPNFFGIEGFFIFLLVQFIRGIPEELDEAAKIDGASRIRFLWSILLPLMKPALFTTALFTFMWSWDNFLGALLYINSIRLYPLPLALNLFLDAESATNWGALFSMMILSVAPIIILFFSAQKYFVQGIATSGLKG